VAFIRGEAVVLLAARLVLGLGDDWLDTAPDLPGGVWHNILANEQMAGGAVRLADLLDCFPVALLVKKE
jgi:(1->4)-alpha-D-glucan 1-alpha-D-glucosylmutase